MIGRCSTRIAEEEEARGSSIAKFGRGSRRSNPGFSESTDINIACSVYTVRYRPSMCVI